MIRRIVYKFRGLWYYWNENWNEAIGPFSTRKKAEDALKKYARDNKLTKAHWRRSLSPIVSKCVRCMKQEGMHSHFIYGVMFEYGKIEIYFNVAICKECLLSIMPKIENLITYITHQGRKQ